MACPGITDILVRESGRIGKDIYEQNFATSPWLHLMPRDTWPEGMGETISVLSYERTAPTDANPTWSTISVVDGAEGGACLPAATQVGIGSTTRTYNLKRLVLEGPDFCAEEARSVFELREQLKSIINVLAGYTRLSWEIRNRHEYFRLAKRKVIVKTGGLSETNNGTETFNDSVADTAVDNSTIAMLTQGVLDKYKTKLIRDGAAQSAMGKADGAPVLTLMIGQEAADQIIRDSGDIQDDLRWGKPNELLRSIGVERSFRGFFHVIDPYPIRYKIVANALVEVPAFINSTAATKGYKAEINPDYEDPTVAILEVAMIYDQAVMTQLIPKPVVAPHPDFKFDPVNYMGSWKLQNIKDRVCNPDGTILYHRGILASGSKPVHPERGVAFLFKRCDGPLNLVTACS